MLPADSEDLPSKGAAEEIVPEHREGVRDPKERAGEDGHAGVQQHLHEPSVLHGHQHPKGEDLQPTAQARPRPQGTANLQKNRKAEGGALAQQDRPGNHIRGTGRHPHLLGRNSLLRRMSHEGYQHPRRGDWKVQHSQCHQLLQSLQIPESAQRRRRRARLSPQGRRNFRQIPLRPPQRLDNSPLQRALLLLAEVDRQIHVRDGVLHKGGGQAVQRQPYKHPQDHASVWENADQRRRTR